MSRVDTTVTGPVQAEPEHFPEPDAPAEDETTTDDTRTDEPRSRGSRR